MKKIMISIAVLMFALTGSAQAAGDAKAGQAKAAACGGCHGVDGNSVAPTFPKLAGQGERYIVKQLADFKVNSVRQDPIMLGFALAVATEQDAADIGAYYAAQKMTSAASHDTSKLALGREIYKGGNLQTEIPACQGCHGPGGAGNSPAGYPQLGGQHTFYTIKQLNAFKEATRSNDDRSIMRKVVARMTNTEIEAVAHYIASLKGTPGN